MDHMLPPVVSAPEPRRLGAVARPGESLGAAIARDFAAAVKAELRRKHAIGLAYSTRDASGNRAPFSGNMIPQDRLDKTGLAIAATFPKPAKSAPFGASNVGYSAVLASEAGQGTVKADHHD